MHLAGIILLSVLAGLGVALAFRDFIRRAAAKKASYVCLCFNDNTDLPPDMIIICRNDAEQEEIIRRIGDMDNRRIYIKYF
jgi:hypothetical protein